MRVLNKTRRLLGARLTVRRRLRKAALLMRAATRFAGLLALGVGTGCAAPATPTGYFVGQCSDGRALALTLTRQDTKVKATVFVEGSPVPWGLEGAQARHGVVTLAGHQPERGPESWAPTNLTFAVLPSSQGLRGWVTFSGPSGPFQFTVTNVAALGQHQRKSGFKVAGRGGGKRCQVTWPRSTGTSALLDEVSAHLATEAKAAAREFVAGGLSTAWQGVKTGWASWSWDCVSQVHIVWLGPHTLSLYQETYQFTGGAHGMTTVQGRNFWSADNQVRAVGLPHLFRPDSGWARALSDLCLQQLRAQGAEWVVQGRVKELRPELMAACTFDRRGLSIHFQPYDVAPGAAGVVHVFIAWPALRPYLDRSGPAQAIPGALASD